MSSLNDSLNSQNMESLKARIDILKSALGKVDKNMDDNIDQQELIDFLDANMQNGKTFDRNLAKKIFSVMDFNQDGNVSIEEFIKTFIQIEDEIKAHSKELQLKHSLEKENNNKLYKQMMEHKNERLNDNGIADDSKLNIEITNIEFLTPIKQYDGISIRIIFNNESKSTKVLSSVSNLLTWKEKFEL